MRHCIRREHSRVPYYQRSYRLPTPRHENFWQFLSFRTITTQPLSSRTSDPLFQNTLTNASCSGTAPARKKVSPSRHRVKATSAFNLRNPLQNVLGVLSQRRVWSSHQTMANVFPSHQLEGGDNSLISQTMKGQSSPHSMPRAVLGSNTSDALHHWVPEPLLCSRGVQTALFPERT